MNLPPSLDRLVDELAKLPTIGRKSARRLAFHLILEPEKVSEDLASAMVAARKQIRTCKRCHGLSDGEICSICSNPARDQKLICVVEDARNIFTIEGSGIFQGVYHVLGGAISPLKGISPEMLSIESLEERVDLEETRELILATNPTMEGEATAHYLSHIFGGQEVQITRIARGMPSGSDLEYADASTLLRAFEDRSKLGG